MRAPSSSTLLRLCTGLALVAAPVLLGARGCELGGSHELCTDEIAPVCGTDGETYDNACEADRAGIEVAHDGACEEACYELYAPVCGDDGETYPNDCFARAAGAGIAHDGACECAPVACLLYCEFGSARDAAGCETCECNPPPVCEEVLCDLYCEHGFAIDPTTGCETCSCNEPRCTSDADCGPGASCEIVGCADYDCGPDTDCPPSECFGFCRALPPPPPSECTSDADCGEGAWCDTSECLPVGDLAVCGGLCRPSEPPPTYCTSDAECAAGQVCIVPEIYCDCAADVPCACPDPVGVCNDLPVDPTEPPPPDSRGV